MSAPSAPTTGTMMGPSLATSMASGNPGPVASPAVSAPSQGHAVGPTHSTGAPLGPGVGPGGPHGVGQGPLGPLPHIPMSMGHNHSNGYSPMAMPSTAKLEAGSPLTSNGNSNTGGPMGAMPPSVFDPPSPDIKREEGLHGVQAPIKSINDSKQLLASVFAA